MGRRDQHLARAGTSKARAVLVRGLELDRMMAVLDHVDDEAARAQPGQERFDQRGLALAGAAGDAEERRLRWNHARGPFGSLPRPSDRAAAMFFICE